MFPVGFGADYIELRIVFDEAGKLADVKTLPGVVTLLWC